MSTIQQQKQDTVQILRLYSLPVDFIDHESRHSFKVQTWRQKLKSSFEATGFEMENQHEDDSTRVNDAKQTKWIVIESSRGYDAFQRKATSSWKCNKEYTPITGTIQQLAFKQSALQNLDLKFWTTVKNRKR